MGDRSVSVHDPRPLGRYVLYAQLAAGGTSTVHCALRRDAQGAARTVAVKCLLPHLASDPAWGARFLDEARVASRVRHPNVVPTLDVISGAEGVSLVMEYVHGESLAGLLAAARERGIVTPPAVAAAVMTGALRGLHAAHEATDEGGARLGLVHRDVSPQNVIVGADGVARLLDFGIARAAGAAQTTREGHVKGKLAYMAPEQLAGEAVGPDTDVYAAGLCFWEALVGRPLFAGDNESVVLARALAARFVPPSRHLPGLDPAFDEITSRALARERSARYPTAIEMALAIEGRVGVASPPEVAAWLEAIDGEGLRRRASYLAGLEASVAVSTAGAVPHGRGAAGSPLVRGVAGGRSRSAAWFALGVSAALLVGAGVWSRGRRTGAIAAHSVPLASASDRAPATTIVVVPEVVVRDEAVTAPASPSGSADPPARLATAGRAHRRAVPSDTRARAAACDEPYRLDSAGVRHYKKECLR